MNDGNAVNFTDIAVFLKWTDGDFFRQKPQETDDDFSLCIAPCPNYDGHICYALGECFSRHTHRKSK